MNKTIGKKENCPVCGAGIVRVCLKCGGGGNIDSVFKGVAHVDSPTGYTIIASNGLILDADSTTAELFGTKRILIVEKPFTLFIDGENLADFFIHRNALFATRKEQNFEIKLRKKDRSVFNAKLKCTFIRNWKKIRIVCRLPLAIILSTGVDWINWGKSSTLRI